MVLSGRVSNENVCTRAMGDCPAFLKKEVVSCAAVWMDLEDIMLSEISPSQKDKYCMIALT